MSELPSSSKGEGGVFWQKAQLGQRPGSRTESAVWDLQPEWRVSVGLGGIRMGKREKMADKEGSWVSGLGELRRGVGGALVSAMGTEEEEQTQGNAELNWSLLEPSCQGTRRGGGADLLRRMRGQRERGRPGDYQPRALRMC